MNERPPLSPETLALLDRERDIPALPAAQRARAMARARAALAAGGVAAPAPMKARSRTRWAAAAAAALLASAAVGAAAYEIRARLARAPQAGPPAPAIEPVARAPVTPPPAAALAAEAPQGDRPEPALAASGPSPAEAARAELRLLREARAAVARRDFAAALSSIVEHTRRFKNGRLAEEREALRVKALAGLGRIEEARHAAAAFRARFPRSVLLPAVSQMPASAP